MIIIAGDSWGEGKFQIDPHTGAKWPGFHHYWKLYKPEIGIENISHGGLSNYQIIANLSRSFYEHYGQFQRHRGRAIVWLTCVLRDYPTNHHVNDLNQWVTHHYENLFAQAVTMAHRHNCTIEFIGGLGDIPRTFPEKLSDLVEIKIYSTAKFVDPDYQYEMPYGHITEVDNIPNINIKSKLLDYIQPKHTYLSNPMGHFPDNAHPGPIQYEKVFQFLK
jgi:hypothetical protein